MVDRAADGAITAVTVIDFKTDAVDDPGVLRERYGGQMRAYARIVASACGVPVAAALLVSTHLKATVALPGGA